MMTVRNGLPLLMMLALVAGVAAVSAEGAVLPQARIDAAIASAKNLHRKPSTPGFSMHDLYAVDGTPEVGYLSPEADDYGFLANGTDVLIVPLISGGSGGTYYTLLFTSIATKPAFIGYVPSPIRSLRPHVASCSVSRGPLDGSAVLGSSPSANAARLAKGSH